MSKFFESSDDIDFSNRRVKEFSIIPCTLQKIREFVETWHYSKSVNGLQVSNCFAMYCDGHLIGGMIFGKMSMKNAWKKYAEHEEDVIELKRLCCVDKTPKNTESRFIGWCIRWLQSNTEFKTVVSYADAYHNHTGVIYRATNFQYHGTTSKGKLINHMGKMYHDKTLRVKHNGELKPYAKALREALKKGEAFIVETPGKHIYTYKLKQ